MQMHLEFLGNKIRIAANIFICSIFVAYSLISQSFLYCRFRAKVEYGLQKRHWIAVEYIWGHGLRIWAIVLILFTRI